MAESALPELDVEKVRRFCAKQWPEDEYKDQVRLEVSVRGKRISIHELRPLFEGAHGEWTSMPIAQLRYEGKGLWTLFYGDRNSEWAEYFELAPRQPIDVIVNELDTDPTCVFWG